MDIANKEFMLELSYRLTVAVNIKKHDLESKDWFIAWNNETLSRAQDFENSIRFSLANKDRFVIDAFMRLIEEIIGGLKQGFFAGHGEHLASIAKIAYAEAISDLGLSECFVLGQQLANNDLHTHILHKAQRNLPVAGIIPPPGEKFNPLFNKSFPLAWSTWPKKNRAFNVNLLRYATNRTRFIHSESFTLGSLFCFLRSTLCPSRFPSTVWYWQDWEQKRPWHLFLAGQLFSLKAPVMITVTHARDEPFIVLLETMNKDKAEGRKIEDCGWVTRSLLWPKKKDASGRSDAWEKMTTKTFTALGDFTFEGERGKNKGTGGGRCRAPAKLAEPDCLIFTERLKE